MRLTKEQIEADDKRWRKRNIRVELYWQSLEIIDRKQITNDDIRFYAFVARKAYKLLKAKQPKLLTLKKTINAKYPMDVFCEIKGEERIFAVTAPVPAQWIGKPDIRYWTARPTEEQRKAEPWKDGEQE